MFNSLVFHLAAARNNFSVFLFYNACIVLFSSLRQITYFIGPVYELINHSFLYSDNSSDLQDPHINESDNENMDVGPSLRGDESTRYGQFICKPVLKLLCETGGIGAEAPTEHPIT